MLQCVVFTVVSRGTGEQRNAVSTFAKAIRQRSCKRSAKPWVKKHLIYTKYCFVPHFLY